MSGIEKQYLDLLELVMVTGQDRNNRTGVRTRMTHGAVLRHNSDCGLPLLTTKKVNFKSILAELAWFLSGSSDCAVLDELNPGAYNIWRDNAKDWKARSGHNMPDSYCGYLYGQLWRNFGVCNGGEYMFGATNDQILNVISLIKKNPESRRIILSGWDAPEHNSIFPKSCLPPCHLMHQIDVDQNDMRLNMSVYIRSSDLFLGLPFNMVLYALLLGLYSEIVFNESGKKYKPGMIVYFLHDAHIYHNHFQQVKTQLSRRGNIYTLPNVKFNKKFVLDDLWNPHNLMDNVELVNYNYHPYIKAEMAV